MPKNGAEGIRATFIEPMLLLSSDSLPEGSEWIYEVKLDGYRAIAVKVQRVVQLRSRNDNDFTQKYPRVIEGLAFLPDNTVLDGELVALDESGRPSFNLLQNRARRSSSTPVFYYVFDVIIWAGRSLVNETFELRRQLLQTKITPKLSDPIRYATEVEGKLADVLTAVAAYGFEGLVAKRRDSSYEAGERSGAWRKMRVNRGQEFVIGGYTIGGSTFDAVIFGYYDDGELIYVARTRNGFTLASRRDLFAKLCKLESTTCPFANLPEPKGGRWGQGLTAAKMAECRWVKPVLVGQFEFVEWTPDNHLRHSRFIALRDDKRAADVRREL